MFDRFWMLQMRYRATQFTPTRVRMEGLAPGSVTPSTTSAHALKNIPETPVTVGITRH